MTTVDPTPDDFYELSPPDELLQGDIFLCPSAFLFAPAGGAQPFRVPPSPDRVADIGKDVMVPAWQPGTRESQVPPVWHATRWGAVMVLSHECELQKDWNALRKHFVVSGVSADQALRLANERVDVDRFAVVSPILTYAELAAEWPEELRTEARLADVRRGQRVSCLPLPSHPEGVWSDVVVSLGRAATVERSLLRPDRRLASLTPSARGVLRHKLERTYATRDLSVLDELEAAVGQTITDVRVEPLQQKKGGRKEVQMVIHLANGEMLHMIGSPVRPAGGAAPSRGVGLALED